MVYFVLMCYGHSVLSPSLILPTNNLLFINVFTAWHRHISPMNCIIQQSREFRRRLRSASSHELSAARHIRAVTSHLLHSLEDILLRTVLFIKLLSCLQSDIVISDTLIVFLTYLLQIPPCELWTRIVGVAYTKVKFVSQR